MIKKMDLHNKQGYISFDEESRTEGSSSRKARYYWRRRRITPYDKSHNDTVTCHCDILPEAIPELIQMLSLIYEDITGEKVAAKTTKEHKREVVKKSAEEKEIDNLIETTGLL